MGEPASSRPLPQIIRVPPPRRAERHPFLSIIAVVHASALIALIVIVVPAPVGPLVAAVVVFSFVLFALAVRRQAKFRRRAREGFLKRYPGIEADPIVAALLAEWRRDRQLFSKPERVRSALSAAQTITADRAQIVCVGLVRVPDVGGRRFEPFIITATELLGPSLVVLPIALVLLSLWLLQGSGVLPWHVFHVGWMLYPLAAAAGMGLVWIWRAGVRPTYVRAAPGIVQVAEYRMRRRKPVIRSYPMEAGTLVVVRALVRPGAVEAIALLRGEQKDTLPVGQMRNKADAIEHIWWALLSTAPIPQLDDEELVG